jgi:ATP-binding cassette subfamily F protein 3
MAGFLKPNSGSVVPNEKVISGYFGQTNVERLNPKNKIWEEVQEANPSADYATVRRICAYMMFAGELGDKRISVLSGGEKSRVLLGKILLSNVNMLFLDEPTNHFDIESADALMDAIKEFDGSLVMVTHDERFLHEIANKLIVFDGGKIFAFHGTYEKFLREVGWKE